jgi:hypothetical protein
MSTNETPCSPIQNVRTIKALVGDAPADFNQLASNANLCFAEENGPWGCRYIIDLADVPSADQSVPLIRQLAAIAAQSDNAEFGQIWLESR